MNDDAFARALGAGRGGGAAREFRLVAGALDAVIPVLAADRDVDPAELGLADLFAWENRGVQRLVAALVAHDAVVAPAHTQLLVWPISDEERVPLLVAVAHEHAPGVQLTSAPLDPEELTGAAGAAARGPDELALVAQAVLDKANLLLPALRQVVALAAVPRS